MHNRMNMLDEIDHGTLSWVRQELDQTLRQAAEALERFAEDPGDRTQLQFCASHLHQVRGILQMLELQGAAMLTEEMEALAAALLDGRSTAREQGGEALMRAILQLRDYLERLQAGQRDAAFLILPLVNDLRAAHGEPIITESALFSPDLDIVPARSRPEAGSGVDGAAAVTAAASGFQRGLLGYIRGADRDDAVRRMLQALETMDALADEGAGVGWWIAAGFIEAVGSGQLDQHAAATRNLAAQLERHLRLSVRTGTPGALPPALQRGLLYYVARVETDSERVRAIQASYRLGELLAEERRLEQAREGLSGPGAETFQTVADAIREDLASVKDTLDLHSRGSAQEGGDIADAAATMARVADTLGVIGLAAPRRAVREHAALLRGLPERPAERALAIDKIAETLLYVEAALAELVAGVHDASAGTDDEATAENALFRSEFRQVFGAAIDEAISEVGAIKEAIVQFLESHDSAHLQGLDARFDSVRGALDVVELERASALVRAADAYIAETLLPRGEIPSAEALDDLADAITSIEYYLEAVRDRRGGTTQVLDVAANSLARLGHGAVAAGEQEPEAVVADGTPPSDVAAEFARKRGRVDLQVPVRSAAVDEEILEIFIEEAEEVLETLREVFPRWQQNPDDQEALATCRRMFHTLKGSGRLAGAVLLGELAWSVENLLNRILDRTLAFDPEIPPLVAEVIGTVPALVEELRGGNAPEAAVRGLMRRAVVLAGEEPVELTEPAGVVEAAEPPPAADDTVPAAVDDAPDEPRPAMDPVLYEIFSRETADHLSVIERFLDDCDSEAGGCRVDEYLVRSLHTLTGSARMADVEPIAQLGRALEELVRARQNAGRLLRTDERNTLRRGTAAIREVVTALGDATLALPAVDELVAEVRALREGATVPGLESLGWPEAHDIEADPPLTARVAAPDPAWAEHPAALGERRGAGMPLAGEKPSAPLPWDPTPAGYPVAMADGVAAARPTVPASEPAPAAASEAEPAPAPVIMESLSAAGAEAEPESDDLSAIFIEEAQDILSFLDGTLTRWEDSQEHEAHIAELHRSLHTLKGGARLAGFDGIGDLCHALESLAGGVASARVNADDDLFDLLRDGLDGLYELLGHARDGRGEAPAPVLLERIEAAAGRVPDDAASEDDDADAELIDIFLEEAAEILAACEQLLHGWRQAPADIAYVDGMQRALHTLKGGARMAGVRPIADLSHALEATLKRVSQREIPTGPALFDVLDAVNDRLIQLRDRTEAGEQLPPSEDLVAALEGLRGDGAAVAATTVPEALPREAVAEESDDAARRQSEVIRVRADLLDNLVNYAGEVSIYRARLEQQAGSVDFNLAELGQTVTRLREQLRTLEIETEAQILYRFEREQESEPDAYGDDFDPLEMDRFSRMQELSRALSESVNDLSSIQGSLQNLNRESETLLLQQSRVNTELQDGLMRTRMVPFASLVPRMRRIVRQAAQELGKRATLKVLGAQGEMDRSVLDRVIAPLEHMLRNAVAHGIEAPELRREHGKPDVGTISVALSREGADVVLRVSDDGGGMNLAAIRRKAVDRGLMRPDAPLTDREVMQFVLEAGFSTAERVTQIAGRGVGMDVVSAEIKQLGGSLDIDSEAARGTRFTVRLPFTLALNHALLCRAGEEVYALPLSAIEGVVRIDTDRLAELLAAGDPVYEYAGYRYDLRSLAAILGAAETTPITDQRRLPLVLVQAGDHRMALQVDGLLGSRDIVVKSVGAQISTVPGVLGATILADGRVVLILDVGALVRFGVAGGDMAAADAALPVRGADLDRDRPMIMVVDDSITMRKVATRLLQRNQMDVVTAKDGVDAVARLQDVLPDAILLDIEMPRMDGYELAVHLRNDDRLKAVPIVMITSRTGEKHRQRALEIGVDRYLGKPYQEADLLATLRELLGESEHAG
jgi:chemosensory pili system protein ChpA (sensor histidine kinase/response regulator)